MAVLVHVAIGLAGARVSPRPLGPTPLKHILAFVLIADAPDLLWNLFCVVGIEHYPSPGPWSHGLLMCTIWSAIALVVAWRMTRSPSTGGLVGLVMLSHWVVDFISHPMTALLPDDPGLPLLFNGSLHVGLGLYATKLGVVICESGAFIVAALICLRAFRAGNRLT